MLKLSSEQAFFLIFIGFFFILGIYSSYFLQSKDFLIVQEKEKIPLKEIYVSINGAINAPGFYSLKEGDKLRKLVKKARGLHKNAYKRYRNEFLSHCEHYYIKSKKKSKNPLK